MRAKTDNLPNWLQINAWREILAQIFEGVDTEYNLTPEWLVNPTTHRRLKLDIVYTNLGVAVRFEGLRGKQQRRRLSLEEEEQQQVRHDARVEVCREHGVQLVVIDPVAGKLQDTFRQIDTALSRANRVLLDERFRPMLKRCRATASSFARKITRPGDLKIYAELWQDRLYQIPEPAADPTPLGEPVAFIAGMEVEHEKFGQGVVLSVAPSNGDTLVTVDFITAGQKVLAASLIGGKLTPK